VKFHETIQTAKQAILVLAACLGNGTTGVFSR